MPAKLPRLERLLKYKNEHVVNRYIYENKTPRNEAEQIFKELLQYFWVSQKSKLTGAKIPIPMYDEMDRMDEMWHTFILFTKEYTQFSKEYFGEYYHHNARYGGGETDVLYTNEDFFEFYGFVFDHVGIDSLNFWLDTPKKTSLENNRMSKKLTSQELKNYAFEQSYKRFFKSKVPAPLKY